MDQKPEENGEGQIVDEWAADEIEQIRLEFGMEAKRTKEQWKVAMEQANILNAKILQQLCVADLDAKRRAELEEEVRKQKEQNAKNAAEIQRLQDEKVTLQNALQKAELDFWAGKEQRQKILDQCIQGLQASDQQTLQKVVEIVDKSKPKTKSTKTHRRHPPPPPPKKNGTLNSIGNKMVVVDKNNNNNSSKRSGSQFDGRQLLVRLGTILDGDEDAAEKGEETNNCENEQKAIFIVNETTKTLKENEEDNGNGNDDTLIPAAGPSSSTSTTIN